MANPLSGMMGGAKAPLSNQAMQNMANFKQAAQSAKRMMNMLQSVKNPRKALMAAAQQNPQLGSVMQMLNGRNPQEVFYEQCKQHGINPDDAVRQIQSMMRN